jgi:hypothetical protein
MAIILANSTCAICGRVLDRAYTATSGCAFPEGHPLWRYCDAPLHLDCLERWPHREEFSKGYFDSAVEMRRLGYGQLLARGESWALVCGPLVSGGLPYFAEVRLTDWPLRFYSKWDDWSDYVGGAYKVGWEGAILSVADKVMAEVRLLAPDGPALLRLVEVAT